MKWALSYCVKRLNLLTQWVGDTDGCGESQTSRGFSGPPRWHLYMDKMRQKQPWIDNFVQNPSRFCKGTYHLETVRWGWQSQALSAFARDAPWGEKCNQRYHLWMTRSFSSRFCFLIPSPLKRAQKVKNTKLQRKKISMKDEKRRRYNSSTEMPGPWGDPMGVDGEHWDRKRETGSRGPSLSLLTSTLRQNS